MLGLFAQEEKKKSTVTLILLWTFTHTHTLVQLRLIVSLDSLQVNLVSLARSTNPRSPSPLKCDQVATVPKRRSHSS